MEEMLIKKIETGIRAIRLNSKSPLEAELGVQFKRLKELNEGMHDDLMVKYKAVVTNYNTRNPKK